MYHATDVKNWFSHIHMPSHTTVVHWEHILLNRRFWGIVGLIVLVAGLTVLLIWSAQKGGAIETSSPYYHYPYLPYPR